MRYDKDQRATAKRMGLGLFTLSYTTAKGATCTLQGVAKDADIETVKAAQGVIITRGKEAAKCKSV